MWSNDIKRAGVRMLNIHVKARLNCIWSAERVRQIIWC